VPSAVCGRRPGKPDDIGTNDTDAYDHYLTGRQLLARRTTVSIESPSITEKHSFHGAARNQLCDRGISDAIDRNLNTSPVD
jgi:hypothetical protein